MVKIRKGEKDVRVEEMNIAFAKVMTIFTIIGIVVMIVPAVFYFSGVNQFVPLSEAYKYWHLSATEFWENVTPTHTPVAGYSWVFDHLNKTDCLSMLGILVLMITPLLSMLAGAAKAENKTYRALLLLAALEFITSVLVKSMALGAKTAGKVAEKIKR